MKREAFTKSIKLLENMFGKVMYTKVLNISVVVY